MKNQLTLGFVAMMFASTAYAADQSIPGAGNANLTAERIEMTYQRDGFEAVARMVESLHRRGRI